MDVQKQTSYVKAFGKVIVLLAMQTAASHGRSVRPSPTVRPSVIFQCFVQMNEDMMLRSSASIRTIIVVSGEVKFIRIFEGGHTQRERGR